MTISNENLSPEVSVQPQTEDQIVDGQPASFWVNLWETIKNNIFGQPLHN